VSHLVNLFERHREKMGNNHSRKITKAGKGQVKVLKFRKKKLQNCDLVGLVSALASEENRVGSLELHSNAIGPNGLEQLMDTFTHPNCQVLRFCFCFDLVGSNGSNALSSAISNPSTNLISLILQGNELGSEGAAVLAKALTSEHNKIHVLYLLNNNIGFEGLTAITEALQHENNKVVELSLAGNSIGNEGVKLIAQIIKHKNNHVRYLRLGFNHIDNQGASVLAKALVDEHSKVRQLDLESNEITDSRELVRAMKLSQLQWIDLIFNHENPFENERSFYEFREVFFQKRQYWQLILALCSAHDVPRLGFLPNNNKKKCYFAMLPKELCREIAQMLYPWNIEKVDRKI